MEVYIAAIPSEHFNMITNVPLTSICYNEYLLSWKFQAVTQIPPPPRSSHVSQQFATLDPWTGWRWLAGADGSNVAM